MGCKIIFIMLGLYVNECKRMYITSLDYEVLWYHKHSGTSTQFSSKTWSMLCSFYLIPLLPPPLEEALSWILCLLFPCFITLMNMLFCFGFELCKETMLCTVCGTFLLSLNFMFQHSTLLLQFIFTAEWCSVMGTCHNFCQHPLTTEYLVCFQSCLLL